MLDTNHIYSGIYNEKKEVILDNNTIEQLVKKIGFSSKIANIGKPKHWVHYIYPITLESGQELVLKTTRRMEKVFFLENSVVVNEKLIELGFGQPKIYASGYYDNKSFYYILVDKIDSKKIFEHYLANDDDRNVALYYELGKMYRRIHSIKNDWMGLFDGDVSKRKYPMHPVDFHINGVQKSKQYLLDNKMLSESLVNEIIINLEKSKNYLKEQQSVLIHYSSFPWTVYKKEIFENTRDYAFLGLSDFMWGDAMTDLAHILYPPFFDIKDSERDAFLRGYNLPVCDHSLMCYRIITKIAAICGTYLPPLRKNMAEKWIAKQEPVLLELLDNIKEYN